MVKSNKKEMPLKREKLPRNLTAIVLHLRKSVNSPRLLKPS